MSISHIIKIHKMFSFSSDFIILHSKKNIYNFLDDFFFNTKLNRINFFFLKLTKKIKNFFPNFLVSFNFTYIIFYRNLFLSDLEYFYNFPYFYFSFFTLNNNIYNASFVKKYLTFDISKVKYFFTKLLYDMLFKFVNLFCIISKVLLNFFLLLFNIKHAEKIL